MRPAVSSAFRSRRVLTLLYEWGSIGEEAMLRKQVMIVANTRSDFAYSARPRGDEQVGDVRNERSHDWKPTPASASANNLGKRANRDWDDVPTGLRGGSEKCRQAAQVDCRRLGLCCELDIESYM